MKADELQRRPFLAPSTVEALWKEHLALMKRVEVLEERLIDYEEHLRLGHCTNFGARRKLKCLGTYRYGERCSKDAEPPSNYCAYHKRQFLREARGNKRTKS